MTHICTMGKEELYDFLMSIFRRSSQWCIEVVGQVIDIRTARKEDTNNFQVPIL
jgi:hypothetical protein